LHRSVDLQETGFLPGPNGDGEGRSAKLALQESSKQSKYFAPHSVSTDKKLVVQFLDCEYADLHSRRKPPARAARRSR
jgi:hypothetical protein